MSDVFSDTIAISNYNYIAGLRSADIANENGFLLQVGFSYFLHKVYSAFAVVSLFHYQVPFEPFCKVKVPLRTCEVNSVTPRLSLGFDRLRNQWSSVASLLPLSTFHLLPVSFARLGSDFGPATVASTY